MNPAVLALQPSLIRTLHGQRRPGDIDLGLGQSTEVPDLAPFEAATRWIAKNGCLYTPNAGARSLRDAVAHQRGAEGMSAGDNVLVTHGSQEAIYLCLKTLLRPGEDEVLIVGPAYGAYAKLCDLEGLPHRVVALPAQGHFTPRAEDILGALGPKTRLVLLASPCNPTGRVWSRAEGRALIAGLKARPGAPVWLVADEVYRTLTYVEDDADLAEGYDHALLVGGLSKSHALTGLRIGWLIAPTEVIQQAEKVHQQVTTVASTFSQRVALEILRDPESFERSQGRWRGRRDGMARALAASGLVAAPLDGAFYAWIPMPAGALGGDSLKAATVILAQERVVTIPGAAFGGGGEGWLRLSYAGGEDAIPEGVGRVARALSRMGA